MRMRSRLRMVGGILLGIATVALGTLGVLILIVSTTWGGGSWISVVLLGAAAAAGGALATLLRQDSGRWP